MYVKCGTSPNPPTSTLPPETASTLNENHLARGYLMSFSRFHAKVINRARGRSAVAAAAYRAAARLYDRRLGRTWRYVNKRGVEHREILLPQGAPSWMRDRGRLWNAVEASEKRSDAQLAREIRLALPAGMEAVHQVEVLRRVAPASLRPVAGGHPVTFEAKRAR